MRVCNFDSGSLKKYKVKVLTIAVLVIHQVLRPVLLHLSTRYWGNSFHIASQFIIKAYCMYILHFERLCAPYFENRM